MTREEAIKTLQELWRETNDRWYEETYNMAIKALEQNEIIRCKDCKHWIGVLFGNKCTMLSGLDYVIATKENDYCSFGERKESEEQ